MAEPGHVRYPLETTPAIPGRTASTDADKRAHVELMDFTSRRSPVLGTRGMVACTQPLAAEVGMRRQTLEGRVTGLGDKGHLTSKLF